MSRKYRISTTRPRFEHLADRITSEEIRKNTLKKGLLAFLRKHQKALAPTASN